MKELEPVKDDIKNIKKEQADAKLNHTKLQKELEPILKN
jgi:hypothetical protein